MIDHKAVHGKCKHILPFELSSSHYIQ